VGEAVTVRQLPGGELQSAFWERTGRNQYLLTGLQDPGRQAFRPGSLIEIQSADTTYLGQILSEQESSLIINVEHALGRAALEELTQAWNQQPPPSE
jgi:hypothetical protein